MTEGPDKFWKIPVDKTNIKTVWETWLKSPIYGKKECNCVVAANFVSGATNKTIGNASSCWCIMLDFDRGGITPQEIKAILGDVHFIWWTTYNNHSTMNKFRVVIPLSYQINVNQYTPLWRMIDEKLGSFADPSAKDCVRIGFLPRRSIDNEEFYKYGIEIGQLFDPKKFFSMEDLPVEDPYEIKHKIKKQSESIGSDRVAVSDEDEKIRQARQYFSKVGYGIGEGIRHITLLKASCSLWWDFAITNSESILKCLLEINDRFSPPKDESLVEREVSFGYDRIHKIGQSIPYGGRLKNKSLTSRADDNTRTRVLACSVIDEDPPSWMDETRAECDEFHDVQKNNRRNDVDITDKNESNKETNTDNSSTNDDHPSTPDGSSKYTTLITADNPPSDYYDLAPKLIKDLALWIDACSPRTNIFASTFSAIGIVSTLCGRKFSSPTQCHTNLWQVLVAPTGAGKNAGRNAIISILREIGAGDYCGTDEIASGAGVVSRLYNHPVQVFIPDEFGQMLSQMRAKNASNNEAQILRVLMSLYSQDNGIYTGKSAARSEAQEIVKPSLHVYAATTVEQLFDHLNASDAVNGLLNRMTFMVIQDMGPFKDEVRKFSDIPVSLSNRLKRILDCSFQREGKVKGKPRAEINIHMANEDPREIPVRYSDKAAIMIREIRDQIDVEQRSSSPIAASLASRFVEKTIKLAMISAICRFIDGEGEGELLMSQQDINWALVAEACSRGSVQKQTSGKLASSKSERTNLVILRECNYAGHKGISTSELSRKIIKEIPDLYDRNKALSYLCDADLIMRHKGLEGDRGRPREKYYITDEGRKALGQVEDNYRATKQLGDDSIIHKYVETRDLPAPPKPKPTSDQNKSDKSDKSDKSNNQTNQDIGLEQNIVMEQDIRQPIPDTSKSIPPTDLPSSASIPQGKDPIDSWASHTINDIKDNQDNNNCLLYTSDAADE